MRTCKSLAVSSCDQTSDRCVLLTALLAVTLLGLTSCGSESPTNPTLQIDGNASTGSPGISSGADPWDADLIGVEFLVSLGAQINDQAPGQAMIFRYDGDGDWSQIGSVRQIFSSDTIVASVPLELLDEDDGRLTFKVTCSAKLSTGGATFIADVMPDVGVAPGRTGSN